MADCDRTGKLKKRCSECKVPKPLSAFSRDQTTKDGRRYRCKVCCTEYQRRYQATVGGEAAKRRGAQKYRISKKGKVTIRKYAREYRTSEKGRTIIQRSRRKYQTSMEGKASKRRYQNSAEGKASKRRYQSSAKGKAAQLRTLQKQRSTVEGRQKTNCRAATQRLVRSKKLIKPKRCESCRQKRPLHGHHEDYARPDKPTWLCAPCHRRREKELESRLASGERN